MKNTWFSMLKHLSWLTQLGVSMATPPVLALLFAWWLTTHTGVGAWVYIPAVILGIGAGGVSFWQFSHILQGKKPTNNASSGAPTKENAAKKGGSSK